MTKKAQSILDLLRPSDTDDQDIDSIDKESLEKLNQLCEQDPNFKASMQLAQLAFPAQCKQCKNPGICEALNRIMELSASMEVFLEVRECPYFNEMQNDNET